MEIRELTALDLEKVMPLERDLFGHEAWLERSMLSELESSNTYYLGIFDPELTGYAGLSTIPASFASDIQTIGITKDRQGRGLGKIGRASCRERV